MADQEKPKEPGDESPREDTDHHEPTPKEETAPDENESSEDECDEAIAGLLARIVQLESETASLREQLTKHDAEYEHHARRIEPGTADGDERPDERHWYFRQLKRG